MKPLYIKALFIGILVSIFASETLAQKILIVESTPSTSCSPPNGTLSASMEGEYIGYSFLWYSGHDTSGDMLSVSPVVTYVGPGIYTIQVTNDTTSEVVALQNVLVLDNTVMPEFSIQVISSNTSCTDTYANGSLSVMLTGDVDTADYTFTWYSGVIGDLVYVSQSNDTIENLVDGDYSVQVTNDSTQCYSWGTATVTKGTSTAEINLVSTDVTSCVSPNGSLTASIEGDSISNYSFEWYEGTTATGLPIGSGNTLDSLSPGIYTVEVLDLVTNCVSFATDSLNGIFPAFPSILVSNANSCSGTEGSIAVVGLNESLIEYSFLWLNESGDTLSTEPEIHGLAAGNYVLLITHNESGCEKILMVTIENQMSLVTASVDVISDRTQCQYADGSISAVVEGSASDYDFAWFMGAEVSSDTISFDQTIDQLAAGQYSVLITNNISGCDTLITASVADSTVIAAYIDTTPVTSCISPNGSATAMVSESSGDYTFVWCSGSGISEDTLAITPTITQLSPGAYTVVVKDTTTWCSTMVTAIINDQSQIPVANVSVLTHATSCGSPNGSMTAQMDSISYGYKWFEGNEVTDTVYATDQTITGLGAGTYTLQVIDETTGCVAVNSGTIYDLQQTLEVIVEVLSHETSCISPDGALAVRPVSQDTVRHYGYAWYEGTLATGSIISENDTVSGLSSGMYTVLVTDTITQCTQTANVEINFDVVIPELAVEITSNVTSCSVPNGSASVLGEDLADYTFQWFEGTTPSSLILGTQSKINNLSPGIYGVTLAHRISGCINTVSIAILDERVYPVATIINNEDVLSTEAVEGFQYQWFFNGVQLDDTSHEILATETGDYSVVVINALGCASEQATLHFEKRVITRNETLQTTLYKGYPNPTNGVFWIKTPSTEKADLIVTDAKGKVVVKTNASNIGDTFVIDLSSQPSGVYVLKCVTKNGTIHYRVVKD